MVVALSFLVSSTVDAARMSVTVAQQSVAVEDTFIVEWYLSAPSAINVIDATLYYSPETLHLDDIGTGSSAVTLWIEAPHSVEPGTIRLVGGIPAGVSGTKIPILRTVFHATSAGRASIALGKNARTVLGDGLGTVEVITMDPLVFPVVPQSTQVVVSPTHPHQDHWYQDQSVTISILEKNPVAYSFSSNPEITPTGPAHVSSEPIVYDHLADGIYYFKVAVPVEEELQELETYRVLIDHTAPTLSAAVIDKHSEVFNGKPSLSIYAVDKMSGIDSIQVKVGWFGPYHTATTPYRLHKPIFGNVVHIRVNDTAGNATVSAVYFRGYLPNWISTILLIGGGIAIVVGVYTKRQYVRAIIQRIGEHIAPPHRTRE